MNNIFYSFCLLGRNNYFKRVEYIKYLNHQNRLKTSNIYMIQNIDRILFPKSIRFKNILTRLAFTPKFNSAIVYSSQTSISTSRYTSYR